MTKKSTCPHCRELIDESKACPVCGWAKKEWFCLKCNLIGEIEHFFANYFDVLLAMNRDHIAVSSGCRAFLGFGRMLAYAAGER
jgi:hypothetical protein